MTHFTITQDDAGERLDKFVTKNDSRFSRAVWQRHIKNGLVVINNKPATSHYALREHDIISYDTDHFDDLVPTIPTPDISILFENNDYLVIEKPYGVQVHKANTINNAPLLTDWLQEYYPQLHNVGEHEDRPGIVHRLDREASGVMVIAKTQAMFGHLKNQFKTHTVHKTYTALTHGVIEQDTGIIDFAIGRSEHGRMAARPKGAHDQNKHGGREAETRFEVVKRFNYYSLVHAHPVTGRTHQIRVHFFALNHPLAGDTLYKFKTKKMNKSQTDAPRLMLHASTLCFTNLQGEEVCYESALPKTITDFITTLK